MSFDVELRLLLCIAINAAILFTLFKSLRCLTSTLLVWLLIQYVSITLTGVIGVLSTSAVCGVAVVLTLMVHFLLRAKAKHHANDKSIPLLTFQPTASLLLNSLAICIPIGLYVAVIWIYRSTPALGDDPLTYHLPAAVTWIQQGKLTLFETWFFNPANTFSPLGGSAFIAWWMILSGDDTLARFVQLPAVVLIAVSVFALLRLGRVAMTPALFAAAAVVVSRPILPQVLLAKDDLYVIAFALCAGLFLLRRNPLLAGIALGLMLSIKITAIFVLPVVLLATPTLRPRLKSVVMTLSPIIVLAGPWYLRNLILTGNPIFPSTIAFLPGLFAPTADPILRSPDLVWANLTAGYFSLPVPTFALALVSYIALLFVSKRTSFTDPFRRFFILGPPLLFALYVLFAPFSEVRFVGLAFVLLIASSALLRFSFVPAFILVACLLTGFARDQLLLLAPVAASIAVIVFIILSAGLLLHKNQRDIFDRLRIPVAAIVTLLLSLYAFVEYRAFQSGLREIAMISYEDRYGPIALAWQEVDSNIPVDARIAYASTSLIYPLFGAELSRRVVFVSPRADVVKLTNFPRSADALSGPQIFDRFTSLPTENAEFTIWIERLRQERIAYVFIARPSPLIDFVRNTPQTANVFEIVFENDAAIIAKVLTQE